MGLRIVCPGDGNGGGDEQGFLKALKTSVISVIRNRPLNFTEVSGWL